MLASKAFDRSNANSVLVNARERHLPTHILFERQMFLQNWNVRRLENPIGNPKYLYMNPQKKTLWIPISFEKYLTQNTKTRAD